MGAVNQKSSDAAEHQQQLPSRQLAVDLFCEISKRVCLSRKMPLFYDNER